jgi:hypothetical protein
LVETSAVGACLRVASASSPGPAGAELCAPDRGSIFPGARSFLGDVEARQAWPYQRGGEVSTMIGLVVQSLPGEMDAAWDRGVERGFLRPRVRFASGRRDAPVRAEPRITVGRKSPSGALIAAKPHRDPVRARVSDVRPQTLERGATTDAPRVVGRRTTVGHGEVVIG